MKISHSIYHSEHARACRLAGQIVKYTFLRNIINEVLILQNNVNVTKQVIIKLKLYDYDKGYNTQVLGGGWG